ncbi:MAG: hypothetical protein LBK95_09505 [Bifidobacteriaceae bacterium]|nr:hypothetical protein [Bifidobacteriaceae bacterium]
MTAIRKPFAAVTLAVAMVSSLAACSGDGGIVGTWEPDVQSGLDVRLRIEMNDDGTFVMANVSRGFSVGGKYIKTDDSHYGLVVRNGGGKNVVQLALTQSGGEFRATGSISYDAMLEIQVNMTDAPFIRTSETTSGEAPSIDLSQYGAKPSEASTEPPG